jgi:hypothetical protein
MLGALRLAPCGWRPAVAPCGLVASFFTASRAHLRRAGPDGPSREQRGGRDASNRGERAARVIRRKRLGFNRGLPVAGRQLSPRPSDDSPRARQPPRTVAPVTGRMRSPPYPAAAPASTTTRPSTSRRCTGRRVRGHSHRGGTPRIVRAGPSSLNGASHPATRDAPSARR